MASEKIAIIGSGNWRVKYSNNRGLVMNNTLGWAPFSFCRGSAVATILGQNVFRFDKVCAFGGGDRAIVCRGRRRILQFDKEVRMWVFEEVYQGRKLSEVINSTHENVSAFPLCFMTICLTSASQLARGILSAAEVPSRHQTSSQCGYSVCLKEQSPSYERN